MFARKQNQGYHLTMVSTGVFEIKIRPKTFACALELVRQGYVLHEGNKHVALKWVEDDEIAWIIGKQLCYWLGDGKHNKDNSDAWHKIKDWYFKK